MALEYLCLSRNHGNTPLEERERLRFPEEEIAAVLRRLHDDYGLVDSVLLCTCNRTELYFSGTVSEHLDAALLALGSLRGLPPWDQENTDIFVDLDAVRHLFRVGAGLESQVLGENQILGQLKNAYAISCQAQVNGLLTNELFHRTFRLGKQVRSRTDLCRGNTSVARAAVGEAQERIGLQGKRVVIIGAGEIAELVIDALAAQGPEEILLVNRSRRGCAARIEESGGRYLPLCELPAALEQADGVFSCTAGPDYVVLPQMLLKDRSHPLWMYDLALPRDIHPDVQDLSYVTLLNIDDLQPQIDATHARRRAEAPKAEALVERALSQVERWLRELSAVPSIRRLNEVVEATRAGSIRALTDKLSSEDYRQVDHESRLLTQRLLNVIIAELKRTARQAAQ